MEVVASAVADVQKAQRPQSFECTDSPGDLAILVESRDDVDPQRD